MANQRTGQGLGGTKIVRHQLEQIDIYEISADELLIMEKGTFSDYLFDIAVSLLSISITLIVTIFTVTFTNAKVEKIFLYALIIATILCLVSFIGWGLQRKSKSDVVEKIKKRKSVRT